ncbi:MAG: discoidin domain-containing protein, partial [Planctomycetes bacterium]|nr:discoidin domain-containing protein [Planctomycetota bacterium]
MCKELICLVSFVLVLGVAAGVTNADIIAYWPFNEGAGDVGRDVVGGFDAQLANINWVAGQIDGFAIETDRSGDEILAGTGPTPTTQDLSIAWWMMDADDNTYETVMNKSEDDSTAGFAMLLRPPGEADVLLFRIGGFQAYGGWGSECSVPEGTYSRGEWVHFVCTYDYAADTATIYTNGVLVPNDNNKNPKTGIAGPGGYTNGVNDPTQPLYIVGQREGFGGIVDEVAIWDHALTPEEVLAVYTLGPLALDPRKAGKPNPDDEATDVPRDVVLSWEPGEFAAPTNGHKVYLGQSFNDVNDGIGGIAQDASSYTPAQRLDFSKTYYWRVDEVNAPPTSQIEFKGRVWSFTTEPIAYAIENITATASSTHQADTGTENTINGSGLDANDLHSIEPTDMWLSGDEPNGAWIEYELDKVHKLHQMWVWNHNGTLESVLGFGLKDVTIEYSTNGTDYTTLGTTHEFARAPGTPGYAHNTTIDFSSAAAKYVRLTVNRNWGGILDQYGLSEVRFFDIPVHAREPSPDSGTTDVDVNVTLGWKAGREVVTHDVY